MNVLPISADTPESAFSDIREEAYVASLVSCAERAGLFSANDKNALQAELYALLCELAARNSGGKSSSLRVEKAEELLESALFSVGMALKSEPTPQDSLEKLRHTPLRTLFADGQKKIKRKILMCQAMHQKLCKQLFDTPNIFYRSTVIEGIAGFFKLYDPVFGGQKLHITADYPTCLGRPHACGIEFIESYLQRIQTENAFLLFFPAQKVHVFLEKLVPAYAETPMNLFEPVFCHAVFLAATGKNPADFDSVNVKREVLIPAMQEDISFFSHAAERLLNQLNAPEMVRQYAKLCQPNLTAAAKAQLKIAL